MRWTLTLLWLYISANQESIKRFFEGILTIFQKIFQTNNIQKFHKNLQKSMFSLKMREKLRKMIQRLMKKKSKISKSSSDLSVRKLESRFMCLNGQQVALDRRLIWSCSKIQIVAHRNRASQFNDQDQGSPDD